MTVETLAVPNHLSVPPQLETFIDVRYRKGKPSSEQCEPVLSKREMVVISPEAKVRPRASRSQ